MSYELGTAVTIEGTWESPVTALRLTVRAPDGTETQHSTGSLTPNGDSTTWSFNVVVDQAGEWRYTWEALAPGVGPIKGKFLVDAHETGETLPQDGDLRQLIPRVRRALEGPEATSDIGAVLSDDEVLGAIADGVASFLLYGGDASKDFALAVTARDGYYNAPIGWAIAPPLDDRTATAIVAQVALDVFFHQVKALKISESIGNEGSTWEWELSASLVRDQLKQLQAARDRAIEALLQSEAPLDSYVSYLGSLDQRVLLHIGQDWIGPPEL